MKRKKKKKKVVMVVVIIIIIIIIMVVVLVVLVVIMWEKVNMCIRFVNYAIDLLRHLDTDLGREKARRQRHLVMWAV
jgi:flagellar basal body-associated protein FliL